MTREDWIKIRDRAANAIAQCISIVSCDHTVGPMDRDTLLAWSAVHQTAVRELTCIDDADAMTPCAPIPEAIKLLEFAQKCYPSIKLLLENQVRGLQALEREIGGAS